MSSANLEFLATLEGIIRDRQAAPADASYTAKLFAAGTQRIAQKVGEEAVEVALASSQGDSREITSETADLLYHLLVLLANQDIRLADVIEELERRHSQ